MAKSSEFRTTFAENIFRQKYAQGKNDTWLALATRLVDDVCGSFQGKAAPLLSKEDRDQLVQDINSMKFIPGGRYLYYAGRQFHGWNNCLSGHHKILTKDGMVRLDSLGNDQPIEVYSPISKTFEPAIAKSHGVQPVQSIIFENFRGKSNKTWEVVATRNHHWPLINGIDTYDIRVGDVVPAAFVDIGNNLEDFVDRSQGFVHGMVFADGTLHREAESGLFEHQLRLCGAKANYVSEFSCHAVTRPDFSKPDPCVYIKSEINLKELPETQEPVYIAAFIKGWLAGDGHDGEVCQLHSINKYAIEWFMRYAHIAGFVVTGEMLVETKDSNLGARQPLYRVNFKHADEFAGFKVVSITPAGERQVYCPFEPKYNRIVIDHGMDTYQCYLLTGEEDTREEWGNLLKRSSDCLMTGGGIGADYSVFREKGRKLGRTGGIASGPIPLMNSVNETGRNVMQGGARRSAIYASLGWQHGDVWDFLKAKDWHDMPIGKVKKYNGEPYTIWDAKNDDFNFHAPLDMTNISVNYNDKFLKAIKSDLPEVFIANVRQALRTGEPGFSFNFGDKEKEVLRNACTEVCSADDSDVCNLGSLNLAAIKDIFELREVTERATRFLICGTLRATMPYLKVGEVREKNRRLGLGLMGIHEWLIRRGSSYEVTPELHTWLATYKDVSDYASEYFADNLGVSRPVAKRAIAPTGTIGILAATTTGIEPLYAVAFKRRYLTEGHNWKYEYVVDSTADYMIKNYGVDPTSIETAASLAAEPERRIKFQSDIQSYVDMSISSTINLPAWGSDLNSEDKVLPFAKLLAQYAHGLRGFTCYPDGARGGQPLTVVDYADAVKHEGVVFNDNDICDITGKGGPCGL